MPLFLATIETALSTAEAAERVRTIVRTETRVLEVFGVSWSSGNGPPFSGTVGEASFKIVRVIGYRS